MSKGEKHHIIYDLISTRRHLDKSDKCHKSLNVKNGQRAIGEIILIFFFYCSVTCCAVLLTPCYGLIVAVTAHKVKGFKVIIIISIILLYIYIYIILQYNSALKGHMPFTIQTMTVTSHWALKLCVNDQ